MYFLFRIDIHFFKAITVKMLVQSFEKFSSVIWNIVAKICPKFIMLSLFCKINKKLKTQLKN